MYFDNYTFRCSALGKIMSPSGKITTGNATYLEELFIGEMEGIRKEITSKYFEKGKYTEEDGINLLNDTLYKGRLLVKNKERKNNGWIQGEADCVAPDGIIYDIKNAFDRFSFGKASLTYDYEWQGRGYMWLWGEPLFRLYYCLNNMPEHMLVQEEKRLFYSNYFLSMEDEKYLELCDELRKKHTYDHMRLHERFRVWDVSHCEEKIRELKEKITLCRRHLNNLFEDRQGELRKNLQLMGWDASLLMAHHDRTVGVTVVEKLN